MNARRILLNTALLTGSTIACLVLAEMATRMLLPPPQIVTVERAPDIEARRSFEKSARAVLRLNSDVERGKGTFFIYTPAGKRLRANTQVLIRNHAQTGETIEITTNELGYRGPPIGPKDKPRVLFLGDSITLATYLSEEQTFVRRVEQLSLDDGNPVEVVNAGVTGSSLKNSLAILVESGLSVEPDVVVVGFYLNDFLDSHGVYVDQLPALLNHSWLLSHLHRTLSVFLASSEPGVDYSGFHPGAADLKELDPAVIRQMQQAYFDTLWTLRDSIVHDEHERISLWHSELYAQFQADTLDREHQQFYENVLNSIKDWGGAWSPRAWSYMKPMFRELERLSKEHGFRLVVIAFPVRAQVTTESRFDYPQQRLQGMMDSLGVPYLDLLPALDAAHDAGETVFLDHCHHTSAGSRIIAENVYRFLIDESILPLRTPTAGANEG